MATYCDGKPPAKVLIQFKNGAKEEVETSNVPINVNVRKNQGLPTEEGDPEGTNGNCCDIPYAIKLSYVACEPKDDGTDACKPGSTATLEADVNVQGKLLGLEIIKRGEVTSGVRAIRRGCDGKEEKVNLLGLSTGKLVSFTVKTIARADGKPDVCDPPEAADCEIIVTDKDGKKVYSKSAECPIKFKVRCGRECADGEIRCESQQYPGYCCHDCEDLARALR